MESVKNTPAYISALLHVNNRAVERAMIVLHNRQTSDEQDCGLTKHRNGRGFNAYDAQRGSYYAKWVLSGRNLTGFHLERARGIALRYVGQLVEEATLKLQRTQCSQNQGDEIKVA